MKNLTVSEAKNHITGFNEISILPFVFGFSFGAVVPVNAVALNNDWVLGKLEVDHEFSEHDNLFIEGDAVLSGRGRHGNFDIGTFTRCEALEITKYAVFVTAVFASTIARRIGFKLLAAVGAYDRNSIFPYRAISARVIFTNDRTGALLRTVSLHFGDGSANGELFAASLTRLGYKLAMLVYLLFAVSLMSTLGRAELSLSRRLGRNIKRISAYLTALRNEWGTATFVRTENVFCAFTPCFWLFNWSTAYGAGVQRHKRNLLSDGWHVCLGHAAPTGGIHNYIRLGANHQTQRVLSNFIIAQVCGEFKPNA